MIAVNSASNTNAAASPAALRTAATTDGMVYNDLRALTDLKTQSRTDPAAALHEVAKQFESVFVNMMLQAMRDALPEDSLFGGSQLRTYREMSDQQLALDLGRRGSLGLAQIIERQLSQTIATGDA